MKSAKQIVYRYNGDPSSEEVVVDSLGEMAVPSQGGVIERKGKRWKVLAVNVETGAKGQLPVHRVFLSDQL